MAVKQASWIQASSHPADTDRLILESLFRRQGVVKTTDLAVTQNGTPNMSVNVAAGAVVIDGTESSTQGFYHFVNDATLNVAIAAAHATLPRIDLIVAKIQDAQYSGATNAGSIVAVTGTAAASPVAPAAPANSVILAQVAVAALATSITNANITDLRTFAGPPGCRVYQTVSQSFANNAETAVTFNAERYDTDNMWVIGSPTRLTINTAGLYLIEGHLLLPAGTISTREAFIRLNGTGRYLDLANQKNDLSVYISVSAVDRLVVGDYVELRGLQVSGGALSTVIGGTSYMSELSATWLGVA